MNDRLSEVDVMVPGYEEAGYRHYVAVENLPRIVVLIDGKRYRLTPEDD